MYVLTDYTAICCSQTNGRVLYQGGGVLLVTDFHLQGIVGFYASVSVEREKIMVSSLAQCGAISMRTVQNNVYEEVYQFLH